MNVLTTPGSISPDPLSVDRTSVCSRTLPSGAATELQRTRRVATIVAEGTQRLLSSILAFLLLVLIAVVGASVVARYGANTSLTFTEELAQWLFLYVIFLAIPVAHGKNDGRDGGGQG